MTERRNYRKGIAKRDEILEVALRLVAEKGYTNATLREIADEASLTKNGLLHHFGSKEELFAEILRRRDDVDRSSYSPTGVEDGFTTLTDTISHAAQVAGLIVLYARYSAEATDPQHVARDYFSLRYETLRGEFTASFERLRDADRLRADADPATCAVQLIALMDGLQTQWLFDPTIDMAAHVSRFLEMTVTESAVPAQ